MIHYEYLPAHRVNDADAHQVNRLLAQLSSRPRPLDRATLAAVAGTARLLVARDGDRIRGMATLCTFHTPMKRSGLIEDVVVDEFARGQGIGEALLQRLIRTAREDGLQHLELTSQGARTAANHLYHKLGFALRETNHYRLTLS